MGIDWGSPKMEVRGPTMQPEGCLARPPPGRARHPPGCLVAPSVPPFAYITPWGVNPKRGVVSSFRRRHGAETYRGEKPSPVGKFRRGDHLPEGEIVAIIFIIVTGIIEI